MASSASNAVKTKRSLNHAIGPRFVSNQGNCTVNRVPWLLSCTVLANVTAFPRGSLIVSGLDQKRTEQKDHQLPGPAWCGGARRWYAAARPQQALHRPCQRPYCTRLELRPMFVGSVIPIGWRGIIVVCATIISRTMIIRSGIVFVRTVRPRTVSIGPVAIAAIGGD